MGFKKIIGDASEAVQKSGVFRAGLGSFKSVLGDQWKEYFYCDSLKDDVLVRKGVKRTQANSVNTKGSSNIITNGSTVAINEGQCALIVEDGKIVDACAEAGTYIYDTKTSPSLLEGDLDFVKTFEVIGKRFTYGGDTGVDQRIYYVNTKEIKDNKFGTVNQIPFRVVHHKIGLDMDVRLKCSGRYSYKIVNPLLFYVNVCGNVDYEYRREEIEAQLKSEFMTSLQAGIGRLSSLEIRPSELIAHTKELTKALNEELSEEWIERRGIDIESVGLDNVIVNEEDAAKLSEYEAGSAFMNQQFAAGQMVKAQAEALKAAASNPNGAMNGFIGMNMANGAGQGFFAGMGNLFGGNKQQQNNADGWTCECGTYNTAKFCGGCGKPKPSDDSWVCECGTRNTAKFCGNCGKPRK